MAGKSGLCISVTENRRQPNATHDPTANRRYDDHFRHAYLGNDSLGASAFFHRLRSSAGTHSKEVISGLA